MRFVHSYIDFLGGTSDMSKLLVAWHHFKTITMHRILVMQGCFKKVNAIFFTELG